MQSVAPVGVTSDQWSISYAVPQGADLCPIFLIYMNDIGFDYIGLIFIICRWFDNIVEWWE